MLKNSAEQVPGADSGADGAEGDCVCDSVEKTDPETDRTCSFCGEDRGDGSVVFEGEAGVRICSGCSMRFAELARLSYEHRMARAMGRLAEELRGAARTARLADGCSPGDPVVPGAVTWVRRSISGLESALRGRPSIDELVDLLTAVRDSRSNLAILLEQRTRLGSEPDKTTWADGADVVRP
jgi:hypothetical protein